MSGIPGWAWAIAGFCLLLGVLLIVYLMKSDD